MLVPRGIAGLVLFLFGLALNTVSPRAQLLPTVAEHVYQQDWDGLAAHLISHPQSTSVSVRRFLLAFADLASKEAPHFQDDIASTEEVLEWTGRILKDDPESCGAICVHAVAQAVRGDWESAMTTLNHPSRSCSDFYLKDLCRAIAFEYAGAQSTAISTLNVLLKRAPRHIPAMLGRGDLLLKQNDTLSGFEDYRRAAQLAPSCERAQILTAGVLHRWGRHDEELTASTAALKANPNSWIAHFAMAMCLESRGQFEIALDHFDSVLVRVPDQPMALYEYGVMMLARGDTARSVEMLRRLIDTAPIPEFWNFFSALDIYALLQRAGHSSPSVFPPDSGCYLLWVPSDWDSFLRTDIKNSILWTEYDSAATSQVPNDPPYEEYNSRAIDSTSYWRLPGGFRIERRTTFWVKNFAFAQFDYKRTIGLPPPIYYIVDSAGALVRIEGLREYLLSPPMIFDQDTSRIDFPARLKEFRRAYEAEWAAAGSAFAGTRIENGAYRVRVDTITALNPHREGLLLWCASRVLPPRSDVDPHLRRIFTLTTTSSGRLGAFINARLPSEFENLLRSPPASDSLSGAINYIVEAVIDPITMRTVHEQAYSEQVRPLLDRALRHIGWNHKSDMTDVLRKYIRE